MLMESVNIVLQLSSCVLVEGPAMKDNLRFFLKSILVVGKPACYLDSWLHIGFCLGISDNMAYVWSVRSITVSCFRIAENF